MGWDGKEKEGTVKGSCRMISDVNVLHRKDGKDGEEM